MKKAINIALKKLGYQINKYDKKSNIPGHRSRPTGRINFLLEDLRQRGLKCNTILDIGANQANWSRMAKSIFPESKFYLVEPLKEMEPHLKKFCDDFDDSFYFLEGVGSKEDNLIFTVADGYEGSTFIEEFNEDKLANGSQRKIKVTTIDKLITEYKIDIPQLIKLDIQGFELEALKGATQTYNITEVFILEVSFFQFGDTVKMPVFYDVISFMYDIGYVVYEFSNFQRRPFDGALGQCDICFVKINGFLRESNAWE